MTIKSKLLMQLQITAAGELRAAPPRRLNRSEAGFARLVEKRGTASYKEAADAIRRGDVRQLAVWLGRTEAGGGEGC